MQMTLAVSPQWIRREGTGAFNYNNESIPTQAGVSKELETRIDSIQKKLEILDNDQLKQEDKDLQEELNLTLIQEEIIWRKRNKIHGLHLEDGSWSSDEAALRLEANSFFHKLFGVRDDVDIDLLRNIPLPQLSSSARAALLELVTLEEVKRAV
ncbi:hypothetical protein PIB30_064322 [Stylosanthes scabra]|uniref:Uncharacterized protein n=1 Tax=Stylosanthes scabra TaxID=79078 RepID=A0ABU6UMB2_9FABA|nr:hypothetical protein [Stylosanthes scabra]